MLCLGMAADLHLGGRAVAGWLQDGCSHDELVQPPGFWIWQPLLDEIPLYWNLGPKALGSVSQHCFPRDAP
jgi:hypothetical protein